MATEHLTPARLEVIGATAAAVAEKVADGTIPTLFYQKMLGERPELFAFFNRSHQPAMVAPGATQMSQPAAFGQSLVKPGKTQDQVLAKAVLAAVENLQNLDAINSAAQRISNRHCALGIMPEHYQLVHDYFLAATAEVLGDAVTPAVADAWSGALLHIAAHFIGTETALYDQSTAKEEGWDTRNPAPFLVERVDHTAAAMTSLYLKRADGAPPPAYAPGQHVTLCANPTADPVFAPRHYTISAPAPIGDAIRITVRHLQAGAGPAGVMSSFVNTGVEAGDILDLRAPFGAFGAHLAEPYEAVAWLTAGAGITTALGTMAPMLAAGKRVVHWHMDRDAACVAHAAELAATPLHGSLRHFGGRATLSLDTLEADLAACGVALTDPATAVFMCFPPAMILSMRNALNARGVPLERIIYEAYGPLAA